MNRQRERGFHIVVEAEVDMMIVVLGRYISIFIGVVFVFCRDDWPCSYVIL